MTLIVSSASPGAPVDPNQASVEILAELPGIGPEKARAIVFDRAQNGPFETLDALLRVPGIGPATLANLEDRVAIPGLAPPPPSSEPPPMLSGALRVDINTATVEDLLQLPGISRPHAEHIVSDREVQGLFATCTDLVRVTGVGPATVAIIEDFCVASHPSDDDQRTK